MQRMVHYPGSCGELIQGKIMERDLLLSCPINLFTHVRVFESNECVNKFKHPKSNMFMEALLKRWGNEEFVKSIDIKINSDIPRGRGFASSTADLCAVYRALISLFNRNFYINELIEECIKIEPTDSIIFKNMTLFDYKKGEYHEELGEYMNFNILVFEGNNVIDTVSFNSMNLPPLNDISDCLSLLKDGIQNNNILKVAQASTISITRNQHRLHYEVIDDVISIKDRTGGLGILGGHSGDVLGIIYDDDEKMNNAYKNYFDKIRGYRCYTLKTLRSVEYEDFNDYSAI